MSADTADVTLKTLFEPLRGSMANFSEVKVRGYFDQLFSNEVRIRMCHPFGDFTDSGDFYTSVYKQLFNALPDLERRDLIILAGTTSEGQSWIGTMGNYMGTFLKSFLNIPPTGHLAHMRYHEFFRFENGKIVEIQAIWDIPELMMQARAWPMAPQLGAYLCTPGPIMGDGLSVTGSGKDSIETIKKMLSDLCRYPANPDPKIMKLKKYWHPRFNWYGPAGIGTGRGISGFRHWHQIPFLNGMPDRMVDKNSDINSKWEAETHWIGQGQYVCETGWPNMRMALTHDGWMGIAPVKKEVYLRSLDFWKLEKGLIRENWVLVDLLDLYKQIGVNVFARMHEFNKARPSYPIEIDEGLI